MDIADREAWPAPTLGAHFAREGSASLEEFRRTLRHDLHTPINAIKGYGLG